LSPDRSLQLSEELKKKSSFETLIIANGENYGVAKGNNIGVQKALNDGCELILISNNDVAFKEDTIEKLIKGLHRHNADMAVPKIYNYGTDVIWAAGGGYIFRNGLTVQFGQDEIDKGQYDVDCSVEYSPTCFMIVKKEVFKSVGLMDENYFVYYDDTDFVKRASKKNKKLWYIAEPIVYHNESTSTGKMSDFSVKYLWRNLPYFTLKNQTFIYGRYVVAYNFLFILIILYFRYSNAQWRLALKSFCEGIKLFQKKKPIQDFYI
jgi:GT2 family glycosyltransferase